MKLFYLIASKLSHHKFAYLTIIVLWLPNLVSSQTVINQRDPAIVEMLAEISPQKIESTIRRLVECHTRHSLSDTLSNEHGIGAARRWIKTTLAEYAKNSGGRLQVEFDPFEVEANGRRIPYRVRMKNVLAILPGSNPDDNRVLIVTGHYDSRASKANDDTSYAPGANDDGSGTAVIMELARVMSRRSFPATIIFAAVAGEEQGLYGSTHLAQRAKDENWHVVAMITNDIVGNTLSSGTNLKDNTH
ncbi:MAG: M20/M25/M40 family metallo-hydrolase, partial [bacterium]